MKKAAYILLSCVAIMLLFSCKSFKKNDADNRGQPVIRYVHLETIFNGLIRRDGELVRKIERKKKLIQTIENIRSLLDHNESNRVKLQAELDRSLKELKKISAYEQKLKKQLLQNINRAIKIVAKKNNLDFILNIGDEVIFAKGKYDITDEIIKEIARLEKRVAPVSR